MPMFSVVKWLECLGARETLSTAMNKSYAGIDQSVDSALVKENETTFEYVPANVARRIDLGENNAPSLCATTAKSQKSLHEGPFVKAEGYVSHNNVA